MDDGRSHPGVACTEMTLRNQLHTPSDDLSKRDSDERLSVVTWNGATTTGRPYVASGRRSLDGRYTT